mmetsp:Transcript_32940/g.39883  ORF Transcript_32940/g.39883 Transcript_32940/m.39883 type:complete len:83 (-) Transcript_32940:337-585(-)
MILRSCSGHLRLFHHPTPHREQACYTQSTNNLHSKHYGKWSQTLAAGNLSSRELYQQLRVLVRCAGLLQELVPRKQSEKLLM